MTDIDDLLSIIENPTRRRILEYLTREPSYPLQLSKELGISQQAVMKNLALMEQNGFLTSYHEESNMGPNRTVYVPNSQFTMMIDLHDNMFTVRMIPSQREHDKVDMNGIDEAIERINELDSKIGKLDEERAELLRERNSIMAWFNGAVRDMEYDQKKELYSRLDKREA